MYEKKIAVISGNETLIRFLELEGQLLGCSVKSFAKMPSSMDSYDCIFLDSDTVSCKSIDHPALISISAHNSFFPKERKLPWPMLTEEFHRIFYDSDAHSIVSYETERETVGTVLWMQSCKQRVLHCDMRTVTLSESEFLIFEALAKAQKKPVSRQTLMRLLSAETGNLADVYVCHLRKKLGQLCGERRTIETVRGVGYRLMLTVQVMKDE